MFFGRWREKMREKRAWEKLMDVGEQVSVFIVYAQSSPNSVKMARKKKKKRRGKASQITVTKFSQWTERKKLNWSLVLFDVLCVCMY